MYAVRIPFYNVEYHSSYLAPFKVGNVLISYRHILPMYVDRAAQAVSTFNSGLMAFTHFIPASRSANSSRVVTMLSELISRPSKRLTNSSKWAGLAGTVRLAATLAWLSNSRILSARMPNPKAARQLVRLEPAYHLYRKSHQCPRC